MVGGVVSNTLNRVGESNLQDEAGYVYKKSKSVPIRGRSFWNCMWTVEAVGLDVGLHHEDSQDVRRV